MPSRFFRRLTLPWTEVAEITIGPDKARVMAVNGRDRAINLADALAPDAIRAALADAKRRVEAHRATLTGQSNVTNE